jgi:transcriptional regulator with XRE-family HTH domain
MNIRRTRSEIDNAYILFQVRAQIPDVAATIKQARGARQISMRMMAAQLGISVPTYSQMEKNSEKNRVSLRQLVRVAQILDCELQWQLRPKSKRSFAREVFDLLLPYAVKHPTMKNCAPRDRAHLLAHVAFSECFPHPEIRRRLGWARKKFGYWPRYLCWDQRRWPFTVKAAHPCNATNH